MKKTAVPFGCSLGEIAMAALSGALLALAFPPFGLHVLAWAAFVPLFSVLDPKRPASALALGFTAGCVFFGGALPWLYTALSVFGHINGPLSVALMALLVAYLSLYFALFAFGAARFAYKPALAIAAPSLFAALEFVRGNALTGFPWALLAHTQHRLPAMIQIASVTGVLGVSFLIMMGNAAFYILLRRGRMGRAAWGVPAAAAIIVAANLAWGTAHKAAVEALPSETLRAVLVQGNIDQERKWDIRFRDEVLSRHLSMTLGAAPIKPDLVVWPEAAMPFFFGYEKGLTENTAAQLRGAGAPVLFGGLGYSRGEGGGRYYNRAYLLGRDGAVSSYDKIHLVPFGEYIPLRGLLFFANKITDAVAGDITAGTSETPMRINGTSAGAQICYEIIFPEGSRRFAANGARFIVNITNDAWYGRSAASAQHLMSLPFRAVENRVPVLRAANTGISCFVSATGEISGETPLFETVTAAGEIQVPPPGRTFYNRYGDVFAWLCAALAAILFLRPAGRRA